MQQNKIQVLSTRMLDEALTAKAAANNLAMESVTFIKTKYLESPLLTSRVHTLSSEPITVVFTSMNAVNAVTAKLPVVPAWKIFCTGGITKEYVINFFGESSIIASAKNATLLAEKMVATTKAQHVVFFCGDQRLNDLPETLIRHGKTVEEIVVYTTEQTPVFIEKNYEAILFFSPSAVHSFFSLNTVPTTVVLFSIGKTTTAAIQSYCTNEIITSEWPGAESMVELIIDFYHQKMADTL